MGLLDVFRKKKDTMYDSIIGKRMDELTEEEQRLMYDKHYITDGWAFFVKDKFHVSQGSGKIVAVSDNPLECVKQINERFPDEDYPANTKRPERQKHTFVTAYYQNPNVHYVFAAG